MKLTKSLVIVEGVLGILIRRARTNGKAEDVKALEHVLRIIRNMIEEENQ